MVTGLGALLAAQGRGAARAHVGNRPAGTARRDAHEDDEDVLRVVLPPKPRNKKAPAASPESGQDGAAGAAAPAPGATPGGTDGDRFGNEPAPLSSRHDDDDYDDATGGKRKGRGKKQATPTHAVFAEADFVSASVAGASTTRPSYAGGPATPSASRVDFPTLSSMADIARRTAVMQEQANLTDFRRKKNAPVQRSQADFDRILQGFGVVEAAAPQQGTGGDGDDIEWGAGGRRAYAAPPQVAKAAEGAAAPVKDFRGDADLLDIMAGDKGKPKKKSTKAIPQ
jgi:hypothetical protein